MISAQQPIMNATYGFAPVSQPRLAMLPSQRNNTDRVKHPADDSSTDSDRLLRIAFFTYSTKPRGSVIHTLELAEALHQLGHDVCVYALDKDGSGFDRALSINYHLIPAQSVDGGIDQLIHQRIQEFVNYFDRSSSSLSYDCFHAQDCISANALAVLRDRGQIPHFIRTVHHIEAFNSPYLQECQDKSIKLPDLCLCVSHYWQQVLQQRYGIHAFRVINGVNLDRFSAIPNGAEAPLKQALGLTGYPIYLTVGGIEPRKNSIVLLQAFTQVLDHHPQAQLMIAGGATLFDYQAYRDQFFAHAQSNGIALGRSLLLPGVIADTDLPALYRIATAFVLPSLKEGWGLVILEAIASGLPVLTANQLPFTEFLTAQQAQLVDPQSPQAIARAMLEMIQPSVAQALIEHSQSVCASYTWKASATMHLSHYQTLTTL
jgi:glycosyltransferase-like protein